MFLDHNWRDTRIFSGTVWSTLWYRTPSFFMAMQEVTPLLLSWTSCAVGNGRFWNIHHNHPMSPCNYNLFTKVKEPLRGTQYNTRDELIRVIGWWIRNIKKDGCANGIQCHPNIWQKVINKGGEELYWKYINVVPLWIKPCQKYRTVAITFDPTLVLVF